MWNWVQGSTGEHCGNNPRNDSSMCRARAQGNRKSVPTAQALGVFWGYLGFCRGFFLSLVQVAVEEGGRNGCTCPHQLLQGGSWFLTELCRRELTPLVWQRAAVMGALCSGRHLPSQEPNFLLLFLFILPVPSWAVWFCFYGFPFTKPLLQSSHQVVINPEITLLLNTKKHFKLLCFS